MSNSVSWDSLSFEQCAQKKKSKMMFTSEDDRKMWSFIAENFLNYGPFEIFSKMKEILGYEHAEKSLYYRFRNILAPNLHFTIFDTDTKLQIAKKFSITLNADFVQEVEKSWDLVFDSKGNIQEFSWKTPFSLTPEVSSSRKRSFVEAFPNEPKNQPMTNSQTLNFSTDLTFFETLRKMISETVTSSNRKLIEELKSSSENEKNGKKRVSNSGMKHYLNGLKGLLDHLKSPELNEIRRRIEVLEEKLGVVEQPLPIDKIHGMLDLGLKMIGG